MGAWYFTVTYKWAQKFQLSLMCVDKARSLPQSGAPGRCFTQIGPSLTN